MKNELCEVDFYEIYRKWQAGAKEFKCFIRSTNFVSLKNYPNFTLNEITSNEDDGFYEFLNIIDKYKSEESIFLLDISAFESMRLGYLLNKNKNFKSIITFKNPLHPYGLIGNKKYINALINYAEIVNSNEFKGYIFILDYDRYGCYSDDELKQFFNNQYELNYEDLPNVKMLDALHYKNVIYISENQIKEDVQQYLIYLKENEITVFEEKFKVPNQCLGG